MNFFTSDLHFGHKNILKHTDRGKVTNEKDHTDWLIEIWNSTVFPGDTVYHLGDFAFISDYSKIRKILQALNGKKIFICGNHDNFSHNLWAEEDGLIHEFSNYKEIKFGPNKAVLCHYPMISWNRQHSGSIMLHGHCHGSLSDEFSGKILDVGIDNYYNLFGTHGLFSEAQISEYMKNRPVVTYDGHVKRQGE